ncbi:MAG TPA: hypothetical protein VJ843_02600 [Candidatus Saccharimonadales bacterium]|nr:hypothetical protein [Candidatus Saccharimonadales bacterium]
MPSRKPDPAAQERYARILEQDDDAIYGYVDDETILRESRRNNRTLALAGAGIIAVGAFVGAAVLVTANHHPGVRADSEATAGPFATSVAPSASESSASPSPSKTTASPSPSESKTANPSPTNDLASPSNVPSPSRSTYKVELPPIETSSAPETHTSAPEACVWPSNGGIVTVAECGDHTAWSDTNHSSSTEHQLGTGMQFKGACAVNGMVRISYGDSHDYVDNHDYFPAAPAC